MQAQEMLREWIRKEGRKKGWLAEQIPIGAGDLSLWLAGKQTPRMVYRIRLLDITGLDLRDAAMWGKE